MLLLIDIGNTNITVAVLDAHDTVLCRTNLAGKLAYDKDFYFTALDAFLQSNNLTLSQFEGAVLASVVPALTKTFGELLADSPVPYCLTVDNNFTADLKVAIDKPEELGADILVAALGAMYNYNLPLAVVDAGTATTVTIIDENKHFIGGIIHPGIESCLRTLGASTALLPTLQTCAIKGACCDSENTTENNNSYVTESTMPNNVTCCDSESTQESQAAALKPANKETANNENGNSTSADNLSPRQLSAPPQVISRNTVDCMLGGVIYGHAAMIDGIIERMAAELNCQLTTVATGGASASLAALCRTPLVIDENLLFKGMALYYRLYRERTSEN